MNGYEKRTELKKELILNAAEKMFFQNGFANTNIVDIAKKANVSKVTLFNYYGSKDELARQVMKRYFQNLLNAGRAILSEQIPYEYKILKLFSIDNSGSQSILKEAFSEEAWSDPYMQLLYSEESSCITSFILTVIQEGKDNGLIDSSIPAEAILSYIHAIAPLLNSSVHYPDSSFALGMHKLFYNGLWNSSNNTDKLREESKN